jgi:hypothetical protein
MPDHQRQRGIVVVAIVEAPMDGLCDGGCQKRPDNEQPQLLSNRHARQTSVMEYSEK